VPACGADVAWAKIQPYFNRDNKSIDLPSGSILVGQVIHEFGSGTNWVHCANPPTLKFSADFVNKFLNRICFLTSADKGISYQAA
jgi:hypothetical protein